MGDYTEEEFQREFVDERTLDEEYEVDSRRVAHVEECSGVDGDDGDDDDHGDDADDGGDHDDEREDDGRGV